MRKTAKQVVRQTKKELGRDGADDSAELRLVEYLVDTPEDKLPEMTHLPLGMINSLVWMVTFESGTEYLSKVIEHYGRRQRALAAKRNGGEGKGVVNHPPRVLLSKVWRKALYQHRRSIEGDTKMMTHQLALKQMELQTEKQELEQFKVT